MIKGLRDAQITDGLPRVLAEQPWVRALSLAMLELHRKTMDYIDASQIYTAIDTVAEEVLDALAVNWKIDWYDTSYDIEQKRRIVKSGMTIRRTMGTVAAVSQTVTSVIGQGRVEEWFEYGGRPGCFRIVCDNTEDAVTAIEEFRRILEPVKRASAWLDGVTLQTRAEHRLYSGFAVRHGTHITAVSDVPAELNVDHLVDEDGNLLIDENGARFIDTPEVVTYLTDEEERHLTDEKEAKFIE